VTNPATKTLPSAVDFEAETEEAIALCDGDMRAIRNLVSGLTTVIWHDRPGRMTFASDRPGADSYGVGGDKSKLCA
jgi:hypothetical protein